MTPCHGFRTGIEFRGNVYAIEAGAYAQIAVSIRLLGIESTLILIFAPLFFAIEAGAHAQISVSIRLLGLVSIPVLIFAALFSL